MTATRAKLPMSTSFIERSRSVRSIPSRAAAPPRRSLSPSFIPCQIVWSERPRLMVPLLEARKVLCRSHRGPPRRFHLALGRFGSGGRRFICHLRIEHFCACRPLRVLEQPVLLADERAPQGTPYQDAWKPAEDGHE